MKIGTTIRLLDARWTPQINVLRFVCVRHGYLWEARADRWRVCCPAGHEENLGLLREAYCGEKTEGPKTEP